MNNRIFRVKLWVVLAAIGAVGSIGFLFSGCTSMRPEEAKAGEGNNAAAYNSAESAVPSKYVDAKGNIRLPEEDYRLHWTHMGSWYVEGGEDGLGNIHDVYAEPEAVEAFRKTGKFPPGAMLVKEIRSSQKAKLTTGEAHWDGGIVQWFVLVKDAEQPAFPGNPNWGHGWGWALFKIKDPTKNVSTDYKADCLHCHLPAAKTDWIFQHGYPLLSEVAGPFKKYPASQYNGGELTDKPAGD